MQAETGLIHRSPHRVRRPAGSGGLTGILHNLFMICDIPRFESNSQALAAR